MLLLCVHCWLLAVGPEAYERELATTYAMYLHGSSCGLLCVFVCVTCAFVAQIGSTGATSYGRLTRALGNTIFLCFVIITMVSSL